MPSSAWAGWINVEILVEVEAATGVPYRRPILRAAQLWYEVYSSCGGEGLRCNVLHRRRPLNFQYLVGAEPLVFLTSLWLGLYNMHVHKQRPWRWCTAVQQSETGLHNILYVQLYVLYSDAEIVTWKGKYRQRNILNNIKFHIAQYKQYKQYSVKFLNSVRIKFFLFSILHRCETCPLSVLFV